MSQNYAEQPIEFITKVTTMNASDDPTALKENEAFLIQNFRKDEGIFKVRKGKSLLNTGNLLPGAIFGLSTFDPLDSDTTQYVTVSNGALQAGSSFPLTEKMTGLTASTLMRLLPFNGKMLINDPSQGMICYDGTTAGWCGVISPKENKLIDDFESVTGWSVVNGTATLDDNTVVHGRHGVKFKADSGTTYSPRKTISSVDLTAFPSLPVGDAAAVTSEDYICLQLVRSFKADFTSLDLVLQSSSGNWSYARISDMKEWKNYDGAGLLFEIYLRRGEFQTGAGTLSWSGITQIGFDMVAATGKQPYIVVDWLRMERAGPFAQELGKKIGTFESEETWTTGAGTIGYSYTYKINLARSIMVGQNANCYREWSSPYLDLETLDNGAPADDIDSIEVAIARDDDKDAGTLTIAFRDTAGTPVTASYVINATDIVTPRIGTTSISRIKDNALVFQLFTIRKDQFTNGGTVDWSSIDRCTITASDHAGYYYVDNLRLVKTKDFKVIAAFEPTETPTVAGATKYGWADPTSDPYRGDEGSTTSLYVKIAGSSECTIDFDFSPDLDLSQYASGAAAQDGDIIGPQIWISNTKNIEEIAIYYDTNDGTFTDYYCKRLLRSASQIPEIKDGWFTARFERREHEQLPSASPTGNWANICKARIKITTTKNRTGVEAYLDQWVMTRGDYLTGIFWYMVTYRNGRGARSDRSNYSNRVEVRNANVMLSSIPTSSGCIREVWRIGGASADWRLVGILGDDEATWFEDTIQEEDLGEYLPSLFDKPMIAKTFCIHDNFLISANLTEMSGGYRHKTLVQVGVEESIDEVNYKECFDVGKEDGFEILALVSYLNRVYAFKERGVWSFDPYNLKEKPICHSRELGILNPFAWAIDPTGSLYFTSTDKTLTRFNGSTFENGFSNGVQAYLDLIPDSYVSRSVGEYFDGDILFAIPTTGDTVNSLIICYDTAENNLAVFTAWGTSIFHVIAYYGNSALIGGSPSDGSLYKYFDGDTDAGSVIVGIIMTGSVSPDPTITKQPTSLYLTGLKLTSTDAAVKVEPYYDLTDSTDDIDFSLTNATHSREECGVPSPTYWPTYIGWKLTTSLGRVGIRSLAQSIREEARR